LSARNDPDKLTVERVNGYGSIAPGFCMKTNRGVGAAIAAVFLSGLGAWAESSPQEALYPSGAPGPVMKTLSQIEPRTAITAAGTVITQPGSYYLASPLSATYNVGIKIQSDDVTLDLNGFSLQGGRANGYFGIYVVGVSNAPLRNVTIRGGSISNFDTGLRCDYVQNGCFEQLSISSNLSSGVLFNGAGTGRCSGNVLRACAVGKNGSYGVFIHANNGACEANEVRDCQIFDNATYGIYLAANSGGQGCDNVIARCAVSGNLSYGVFLTGNGGVCSGNRIEGCTIFGNGSYGVTLSGIGGRCSGNSLADNCLYQNTTHGIYLNVANNNMIADNHVSATEANAGLSFGVNSANAASNVVVRNTCSGQISNYVFGATDTYGPVVTNKGALAASGAAMHPWANFSR